MSEHAGTFRQSLPPLTGSREATGFTAMQRSTGWDGSIKAILNARGLTPRGVHPAEVAVPGSLYASELRKRGLSLSETVTLE